MLADCQEQEEDKPNGYPKSTNLASKRAKVQFNSEVDYHEFVPDTPEE